MAKKNTQKAQIFIGSSVESLKLAYAAQQNLERSGDVTVWDQGIFEPSSNTLEALLNAVRRFDFGIFIFSPDDYTFMRHNRYEAVRDNVIFELGLFVGGLGKERCFIVMPRNKKALRLPSDLLGITPLTFDPHRADGSLRASLGAASNDIRTVVEARGPISRPTPDRKLLEEIHSLVLKSVARPIASGGKLDIAGLPREQIKLLSARNTRKKRSV